MTVDDVAGEAAAGETLPASASHSRETNRSGLPWSHWPRAARLIVGNIIVALSYAVVGSLSLYLVRDTGIASPVWPAAGLAFAVVFLRGAWLLPGVAIGSFLVNLPALIRAGSTAGSEAATAGAIALVVALGAYSGAVLVRRFVGPHPGLVRARGILLFLVLGGLVASGITATLATVIQSASGVILPGHIVLVWLTWWVGDAIGVIVFAPIVMMFSPGQGDVWRARRWKIIVPSLVVLAVAVIAVMQNASLILGQRTLLLEQEAHDAAGAFQGELTAHSDVLDSIVSFRSGSTYVSQEEFQRFTESFLDRHTDIQAVSWNPIIHQRDRAAYEAEQAAQPGMAGFQITERTPEGDLVRAADRAEYVTVGYIEPMAKNRTALGFDVYSSPVRAAAIDRVRTLGIPQMTAPIDLVQEAGEQKGVLYFFPSKDSSGALDGFAVGVYRMGDLLTGSIGADKWADWNFRLVDTTNAQDPVVMANRVVDGDSDGPPAAGSGGISEQIDIGGRTWTFEAWPSAGLVERLDPATPVLLLLGTLLITFLLEAFLLLVTGMERQWRREADSSSYDANHDELTGLTNRRGFFQDLEAVTARSQLDGSLHVLMFLDLDGFKPVNDTAGHDAGDEILRRIGQALHGSVRDRDTVARIGGDEFAILAYNCPLARGQEIAHAIQRAVNNVSITRNGQVHSVGVSIGITCVPGTSNATVDELLHQADAACYEAKHAGRNVVRVFSSMPVVD